MPRFQTDVLGHQLSFESHNELFSPRGADAGTIAMLGQIALNEPEEHILDLGCGYGLIGIYAAHELTKRDIPHRIVLSDKDEKAVHCATANITLNHCQHCNSICSDGFRNIDHSGFTKIICHPPYHSDFSVAKHFIEKGFNRLRLGGLMYFVAKRELWYRNKFKAVFGNVRVHKEDGYYVFSAKKNSDNYGGSKAKNKQTKNSKKPLSKKLAKKQQRGKNK